MSSEPVDMSPEAIARRLRALAGLYRLARSLKQARILGPVEPVPDQGESPRPQPPEPSSKS